MLYRTSIGLDVHARSIAATAFIPETGEMVQKAFPHGAGMRGLPPRPDAREAPAPGVPAQEGDRASRKDRMDEGPQGMARQARIRGPLRAARLRGMPREREVARAQAHKARRGHRGARRRGGHGPCGLGPEVRQGDTGRDRLLHRSRDRGLLPLPGCTVVHVLRGARAIGAFGRGERLARQHHPDGQHPCEDPPRGGGRAARTAPEADVCGSHGRCSGRACRCRRGCRAGELQAPQPCCPSERARQACQRREPRHRAGARSARLGARPDGRMMPRRPLAAA